MAVQISGNDITVPRDGSFTRNVTIGGTLTYEDVTNIDSVGLVTARNGIEIGARPGVAASISVDGNMIVSGISTFNSRVLLGTTTEGASGADQLTVASSSHGGITIRSGSTSNGNLMFSDGTSGAAEYAGYVQYEHDNNKLNIGVNGSTKLLIDSSGNVGVGENSPANLLHVKVSDTGVSPHASAQIVLERSGTNYLQFLTAADGTSGMLFGDANDNDVAKIVYDHNVTELQFNTETAQRMKITGGGIVQIGGNIANSADTDASHSKLTIKQSSNNANGGIYLERSGERRGFYAYVGGGLSQSDALSIRSNQLGTTTDVLAIDRGGDVAIGAGDLFFSTAGKGIVLGATSNTDANTLDDYEEGTFTPEYNTGSASSAMFDSATYRATEGHYTKVGRLVTFTIRIECETITNPTSGASVIITALPFTQASGNVEGGAFFAYSKAVDSSNTGTVPVMLMGNAAATLNMYKNNGTRYTVGASSQDFTEPLHITGTYFAA